MRAKKEALTSNTPNNVSTVPPLLTEPLGTLDPSLDDQGFG